ncbi:hypothetical protein CR513_26186, partial [Mucuna pruriens]
MEVENQFQTRPWRHVHVKLPDMQSLWYWDIEVQPAALEVLAQYYDVFLRCFTFKDFQIAPTLEEYECILGLPLETSLQYFYRGQTPSWSSMAKLLKVTETRISREKRSRNGVKGIYKSYLEERLYKFRQDEDWPAFMDVYELLIYGIVLFPHGDDYIDLVAVDAYLARRDRGENPIMALLANTYYTLNHCCKRRGGNLRCCIPLLYLWMTTHLFHSKIKSAGPIEDFKWCWIKIMSKDLWAKHLDQATERTIRWYPMWNEREEIIVKCGGFPNVLLLGTQGAISYNPELLSRQAGYPMIKVPSEEDMSPFISHGLKTHNGEFYRKIRHAWRSVIIRGKEWGTRKVEEDLAQKEVERKSIKRRLEETATALASAEQEIYRERQLSDQAKERARVEEKNKIKIGSCLRAADQEIYFRRAERDPATLEKEQLKEALSFLKEREAERETQLLHFQEKTCLLEKELVKAKSTKEQLINQRQRNILELAKV